MKNNNLSSPLLNLSSPLLNKNLSSPLPYKVSILGKSLSGINEEKEKENLTNNLASDSETDKAKERFSTVDSKDLPLESNYKGLDTIDSGLRMVPSGVRMVSCILPEEPSKASVLPVIRLERKEDGSFYFSGLDEYKNSELLDSRILKEILDCITGKIRELESVNDKGYINFTQLSKYPVLCDYLPAYVILKEDLPADSDYEDQLDALDSSLSLREKRVIIK